MTWLIGLFATAERVEAIVGDLEEESRTRGRVWYWRHGIGSIPHLISGQLRAAPFAVAGFSALALFLFNAIAWSILTVAESVVRRYPVYHSIPAATFWPMVMAVELYAAPVVAGWIVGKVAREHAVTSIVAMSVVVNVWTLVVMMGRVPPELALVSPMDFIPRVVLRAVMGVALMVAGAAVARVRTTRPSLAAS